jgi:hypothetical protein
MLVNENFLVSISDLSLIEDTISHFTNSLSG